MAYSAERLPVGGEWYIPLESLVVPQRRTGDAALHILELFRRAALHLHLG